LLLSVLGEGTSLALLWFIERYAQDPITAAVTRPAVQDEARHVAFGFAHLGQHVQRDPGLRPRSPMRSAGAMKRSVTPQ
jgi:hypothetical protein